MYTLLNIFSASRKCNLCTISYENEKVSEFDKMQSFLKPPDNTLHASIYQDIQSDGKLFNEAR